jgi:hypothetical protein
VYCLQDAVIQNHNQDSEKAISLPLISNKLTWGTKKSGERSLCAMLAERHMESIQGVTIFVLFRSLRRLVSLIAPFIAAVNL